MSLLSVVIVRVSRKESDLERCLAALKAQQGAPEIEIVVPRDEDAADARPGSHRRFDLLRAAGLRAARGTLVAMTEDHAVASPTWAADLVAALAAHPRAAAVGGAIRCGATDLLARAVWACDFGRYADPREGPARYVSDSNVVYRVEALESVRDLWESGYRETVVHDALAARGFELRLTRGGVVEQIRSGLRLGPALRERVVWGRAYAAARGGPRALLAIGSPLLPFLLTWRLRRFVACLPLIFVLESAWAYGEFLGYATGRAEAP